MSERDRWVRLEVTGFRCVASEDASVEIEGDEARTCGKPALVKHREKLGIALCRVHYRRECAVRDAVAAERARVEPLVDLLREISKRGLVTDLALARRIRAALERERLLRTARGGR